MKIVFACGSGGPSGGWGPTSFTGGSEEQAIGLARELAKLGHEVVVSNNCGSMAGEYAIPGSSATVTYQPFPESLPSCDILAGWRDFNHLLGRHAPVQVLLCHDIPHGCHWPNDEERATGALDNIDFVHTMNDYHRGLYSNAGGLLDEQIRVVPIGLDLGSFDRTDIERIPGRCVYCSHPNRGVHWLRDFWPAIKRMAPHATLQPCWWDANDAGFFIPPDEALGILPTLLLDHAGLSEELLKSELLTYPSRFGAEISPASTIKAQAAGAIPVTINAGGMVDTVRHGHVASPESFADAVANALNDTGWQADVRPPMMAWARDIYGWEAVASKWIAEFGS